jgi:hypothetical protein
MTQLEACQRWNVEKTVGGRAPAEVIERAWAHFGTYEAVLNWAQSIQHLRPEDICGWSGPVTRV